MLIVSGIPLDDDYPCIAEDLKDLVRNADFVIGEERKKYS